MSSDNTIQDGVSNLNLLSVTTNTNISDQNNLNGTFICFACQVRVVKPTLCPICEAPFHPSCASKSTLTSEGGYKKCCGPPSSLFAFPTLEDITTTLKNQLDIFQMSMAQEFHGVKDSIAKLSTSISSNSARIVACETQLVGVDQRVEELKVKIAESNKGNNTIDFSSCLIEMEDRNNGSKHLILFGVEDCDTVQTSNINDKDKAFMDRLLASLSLHGIYIENIKTCRIGSNTQGNPVPRPLKIIFQNSQVAQLFHHRFLQLKLNSQAPPELVSVKI